MNCVYNISWAYLLYTIIHSVVRCVISFNIMSEKQLLYNMQLNDLLLLLLKWDLLAYSLSFLQHDNIFTVLAADHMTWLVLCQVWHQDTSSLALSATNFSNSIRRCALGTVWLVSFWALPPRYSSNYCFFTTAGWFLFYFFITFSNRLFLLFYRVWNKDVKKLLPTGQNLRRSESARVFSLQPFSLCLKEGWTQRSPETWSRVLYFCK